MKSAIAEHIKGYLLPALHPVVDARVEEGIRTYGQTLDDNVKPERAKAVHQLQELLDAMKYRRWRSTATVGERPGTPELADLAERRQEMDLARLAGMANEIIQEFPDLTLDEMLFREGHSGAERQGATAAGEVLELLRILDHDLAPENDHPTRHIGGNPYDLLRRAATIIRAQAEALERLEGLAIDWAATAARIFRTEVRPDGQWMDIESAQAYDDLMTCARQLRALLPSPPVPSNPDLSSPDDDEPETDPFLVGQRVIVHTTQAHIHDTSDGEDVDEFCGDSGVIVADATDRHYHYLVYVNRTQRVYECVMADLSYPAWGEG